MSKNTLLFLTTLSWGVAKVYSQPVVDPDKYVDDGKQAQFTCKDTLKTGEVLAWYQTKGISWPEDKLLRVTQQLGAEQSVELTLEKTLEQSDNGTWVYCAKQSVQRGGSFEPSEREAESQRIHIEFHNNGLHLAELHDTIMDNNHDTITPSIKLEPNDTSVDFTLDSTLTLTCSGSPPVDGRTYTWFRKVSGSNSNLILLENQTYDDVKSTNVLTLSPDKSYDQNQVLCTQGYVAHIQDPDGSVIIKSYDVVASDNVTLNMKEIKTVEKITPESKPNETVTEPEPKKPDDSLFDQMWGPVLTLLAMMLAVALLTTLVLMMACRRSHQTEEQEA